MKLSTISCLVQNQVRHVMKLSKLGMVMMKYNQHMKNNKQRNKKKKIRRISGTREGEVELEVEEEDENEKQNQKQKK